MSGQQAGSRRGLAACRAGVERLLVAVAVLFLTAAVLIVIANVAARYVWHVALPWSAELARFAIVWGALLAAAVLVSRRQHLTVDLLSSLSGRWKRLLDVAVGLGSMTFYLVVAVSGALLVWRTRGQVASSIEPLPMSVVYAIVPLSAALMWLAACLNLLEDLAASPTPEASRTLAASGTLERSHGLDEERPA